MYVCLLFGAHTGKAITDNLDCYCGLIYGLGTQPKLRRTGRSDEDHSGMRKLANTAEKSFNPVFAEVIPFLAVNRLI